MVGHSAVTDEDKEIVFEVFDYDRLTRGSLAPHAGPLTAKPR